MKNKLYLCGLFLPLLCFLTFIGFCEYQRSQSCEITIPVSGYDPRSLIAGHYILLTVDTQRIDCSQFSAKTCPEKGYFQNSYKYFVAEEDARPLENLIRKPKNKAELVFTILRDQPPQIKELLINGKKWKEAF